MQLFNGCIENIDDKLYEHYGTISQLGVRAGEEILHANISYMLLGPIIAMVVEGPNVIAGIRKLVGATAPEAAAPGTIRGDFCPAIGVEDSKRRVHVPSLCNHIHLFVLHNIHLLDIPIYIVYHIQVFHTCLGLNIYHILRFPTHALNHH